MTDPVPTGLLPTHVAILGSGSWGTAVAILLAERGCRVTLWGRDEKTVHDINARHVNPRYLPETQLPASIVATSSLASLENASLLVFAVPSEALRHVAEAARAAFNPAPGAPILSCVKGIEGSSGKRPSEVLSETFPGHPVAVLSGPTHAEEVALHLASAALIGCHDLAIARDLQDLLTLPWFRTYTSSDVTGMEWGGAAKNVFAIAAGIAEGLGLGDNAKAALVARGLAELTRLGIALGGVPETFQGLSGVGDLIVTCYSTHSRNHRVGLMLGKGHTLDEVRHDVRMVAEGVPNTANLHRRAAAAGVRTPIIDQVYAILYENKQPAEALLELLNRDPRPESG